VTSPAPTLRQLLAAEHQGVLATLSAHRAGWPFASLAPYATSLGGEPLLLLSELAEHTRNLRQDPRASLLVQDSTSADDPQAGARVTLLGTAAPLSDDDTQAADARTRYIARHPLGARYLMLGDFRLWVLHCEEARLVNGFGDMGWLAGNRLRTALTR
jgi:putative heme iron utilization protein